MSSKIYYKAIIQHGNFTLLYIQDSPIINSNIVLLLKYDKNKQLNIIYIHGYFSTHLVVPHQYFFHVKFNFYLQSDHRRHQFLSFYNIDPSIDFIMS